MKQSYLILLLVLVCILTLSLSSCILLFKDLIESIFSGNTNTNTNTNTNINAIETNDIYEPNNTMESATFLPINTWKEGILPRGGSDVDYFRIQTDPGKLYYIDFGGPFHQPGYSVIDILDSSGNLLYSSSNGISGWVAFWFTNMNYIDHYIRISGDNYSYSIGYEVAWWTTNTNTDNLETEPNNSSDQFDSAIEQLVNPNTFIGEVWAWGLIQTEGDEDWYRVWLNEGTNYKFTLGYQVYLGHDYNLYLYDANSVVRSSERTNNEYEEITFTPNAGEGGYYWVVVKGIQGHSGIIPYLLAIDVYTNY